MPQILKKYFFVYKWGPCMGWVQSLTGKTVFWRILTYALYNVCRSSAKCTGSLSWVDMRDKVEVLGLRFFGKLCLAVGIPGVAGVDRLLSFMVSSKLQNLVAGWQRAAARENEIIATLADIAKQLTVSSLISKCRQPLSGFSKSDRTEISNILL